MCGMGRGLGRGWRRALEPNPKPQGERSRSSAPAQQGLTWILASLGQALLCLHLRGRPSGRQYSPQTPEGGRVRDKRPSSPRGQGCLGSLLLGKVAHSHTTVKKLSPRRSAAKETCFRAFEITDEVRGQRNWHLKNTATQPPSTSHQASQFLL